MNKSPVNQPDPAAAIRKRVAKISTTDLLMWAEQAFAGGLRYLDDFRRNPDLAFLGEIQTALIALGATVDELVIRVEAQHEEL